MGGAPIRRGATIRGNTGICKDVGATLTDPLARFSFGPLGLITRALAVAEFSESESLESQFSTVGLCRD